MIIEANCKINLGLDILRRRPDGFHDVETVMYPVRGLFDVVEVTRTEASGAEFRAEGLAVDCDAADNLCLRAFRLMHDRYGVDGVRIRFGQTSAFRGRIGRRVVGCHGGYSGGRRLVRVASRRGRTDRLCRSVGQRYSLFRAQYAPALHWPWRGDDALSDRFGGHDARHHQARRGCFDP